MIEITKTQTDNAAIESALVFANGRRHQRVLDIEDLYSLTDLIKVWSKVPEECGVIYCQKWAITNNYFYPAQTTEVSASAKDGVLRVDVGVSPAPHHAMGRDSEYWGHAYVICPETWSSFQVRGLANKLVGVRVGYSTRSWMVSDGSVLVCKGVFA